MWLEDPPGGRRPRPAPRIPAGLANQVDFAAPAARALELAAPQHVASSHRPTPTSAPVFHDPAMPSGGPTASALSGQGSLRPTGPTQPPADGAGPPTTSAAAQLRGPLMTHHAQKGWEVVADMQSTDWPEGVPVPRCEPTPHHDN